LLFQTQNKAQFDEIVKLRAEVSAHKTIARMLEEQNSDRGKALVGVCDELNATKKLYDEKLQTVNHQRMLIESMCTAPFLGISVRLVLTNLNYRAR